MMKSNKNLIGMVFAVSVVFSFAISATVFAATTPSLGAAATYGVLSSTYTNTSVTTINGDVGFTTGPAVAPLGVHTNYGSAAPYATAGTDQGSALSALASQPCTFTFAPGAIDLSTDTTHGPIGVYTPGVYCSSGAMDVGGPITLNGTGTYIFRPVGALTSTTGSVITLAGASACDVFWTPTQATTLAANTTFVGNVIDAAGITINANTTWTGRALAFGGTVTTDTDTITVPTCTAPIPPAPVIGGGSTAPKIIPLIGITKVPSPLALPSGPGPVTYNYNVWNVGKQQALAYVTVADNKCSPVKLISGDVNNDSLLDPGEIWKYSCSTTLATTTTNTAVATGYSNDGYHQPAVATAIATVVVGSSLTPPLINIVKVPSRLTPFPFGGGNVTYSYTVTNPGVVAMNNVTVSDNKCSPVSFVSGDTNSNNLLDPGESWIYTCQKNVPVSISNIATASGKANGLTALGYAYATVLVSAPALPNTGFPPEEGTPWNIVALAGILAVVLTSSVAVLKKRKI